MKAGNEENGACAMSDATLTCNAISKLIGISHRCNQQKCLQRTCRKKVTPILPKDLNTWNFASHYCK